MTYYAGTSVSGTALSGAPSSVGTFTVLANFSGSTDYTSGVASTTFSITKATPTVTVSDAGGMANGAVFTATDAVAGVGSQATPAASLESVAPSSTYYAGTSASGTALTGAPSTAGTYTVVASFAGSTDYTSGTASTTFSITPGAPTITVSDAGGTYNGTPYMATTTAIEGQLPTLTYYSGTSASGTALGSAPSAAGTYTVVASFGGSTDFTSGVASATFTITPATPTIQLTPPTSYAYNGEAIPATSFAEDTEQSVTVTYYFGTSASGTGSSSAPSTAGTYTVVSSVAASTDYTSGATSATYSITPATPLIQLPPPQSRPYNGQQDGTIATVEDSEQSAALTYYSGTSASGTGSSSPPSQAGTYTVVATAAASTDYTSAVASATFTITPVAPTIQLPPPQSRPYNGEPDGTIANVEDGEQTATLTYYSGTGASGTGSSSPPSQAGTYTVVATAAASTDFTSGMASATFTITPVAPTIQLTPPASRPYNAQPDGTSAIVQNSEQTATLTYYSGTGASGTGSSSPPSQAGTYTVVASVTASTDFTSGVTSATFTISQVTPTVTVSDSGGRGQWHGLPSNGLCRRCRQPIRSRR